ncbi:MAG: hypothetical protein DI533_09385 [Cereibacter sphaeroides]|uniref:VPLPA-CTERM sorting domain-containing protein n=1 Tax=Cereibacter sphaeroides TaxID=1063 RepID=A0A2W5SCE6_CERSP|nr:MAG: hypothetical protein DI533_09385 [Cereibacter sphaeroides]
MFSVKALLAAASLAVALIGAAPTTASTITVTQQTGNIFGNEQWDLNVRYKKPEDHTQSYNVMAGAFQLKTSDWKGLKNPLEFMAFCLTPFTYINLGGEPNYKVGTALSTSAQNLLGALAHGAWASINNAITAAAFQLAVWEIAVDSDTKPFDLGNGLFRLNTLKNDSLAARLQAEAWLAAIKNNDPAFARNTTGLTFLSVGLDSRGNHKTQDLLTYNPPAPVPLPGALGFLAIGLAALAAKGRARRA